MAVSTSSTARFSTDGYAPHQRFPVWRDVFGRSVFNVEIERYSDGPFRASATIRTLPGIRVLTGSSSGVIYRRTADLIQSDTLMFSLGAVEGAYARQRGREAAASSGDAILMLGAEPTVAARAKEGPLNCLSVPRASLVANVVNVEDSYCRRIPASTPTLQLLARYLAVLDDVDALATPELNQSVATHLLDLVALTLGATGDAADIAEARGLRAARLKAIKDDIAHNLTDEALSVGAVAARHRLTPRYIQKLFEESGSTFTEYVVAQRLARAHRLVSDPRRAGRTLTAIAFEVGFGDLSYFNRTFRRRFGASPSEVRAQARREASPHAGGRR